MDFLLGILGLFIVFCMCTFNKDEMYRKKVARMWADDDAAHNYNYERQSELQYRTEWDELAKIHGKGMSVFEFAKKKFGSEKCAIGAQLTMIKEIMEREGYDYRPERDTWLRAESDKHNGFKPVDFKGSEFEGL